ncbi:unnamed protein product [Mortierella alpina]
MTRITSVILALSAVVALTQAQVKTGDIVNTVNGALGTVQGAVQGAAGQVTDKLAPVTGALPKTTLRRRQNVGQILGGVTNVAGQRISDLPLRKRGPVEDITGATEGFKNTAGGVLGGLEQKVGELTATLPKPTLPGLKRTLPSDLGLTAEGVLEKIKPITAVLEGALVSGVKKAIEAEAGHTVHLSVGIAAQLKAIVIAAVKAEIASLVAQISALVGIDITTTIHSSLEHLCAVLIPEVNVLLQSNPLTKDITLSASDVADLTLEKVIAKIVNIAGGLPPKVEETVGQVQPKVEETLGQVKPKVDETVEKVKSKVDETVGQVKPKVDETIGQVKPKIDETVEKVKSTVPVQVPAVPAV